MNRLEKLKELEQSLYETMQKANSRSMAALARQYRETIREIEELEGEDADGDEIAQLIAKRAEG
ncbi:MAG: hypothetical protein IJ113_02335 [Eggerthellaceae bacterium]|nr:hypothetical protein [Eggerthellaceae bacterium]MBQ9147795.1 hypothetical protein [Rikenellaceae bacterium]